MNRIVLIEINDDVFVDEDGTLWELSWYDKNDIEACCHNCKTKVVPSIVYVNEDDTLCEKCVEVYSQVEVQKFFFANYYK